MQEQVDALRAYRGGKWHQSEQAVQTAELKINRLETEQNRRS